MNKLLVLLIIPVALSAQSSGVGQSGTISSNFSAAGAASAPGLTISGNPYTGGTATTNFPQVYLNGGTGPTTFSTAGTYLGINTVSGFTGNLFDAHVNGGSSVASINYQGNALFSGTLGVTGHLTIEGVTTTGATGTGKFVFDGSPTLVTPNLGTPSAVTLTNGTGLPLSGLASQAAHTIVMNGTAGSASPTATAVGTGVDTWIVTPSGANLASALTTALPNTKGGTGGDSSAATGVAQVSSGTWSYSTALASGTTATTQSAADNSTKVSTTAYADSAVAAAPRQCEVVWGGTGTSNALTSGDDAVANNSCFNKTGKTWTITALYCKSDSASNTTTVNPTFGSTGTGTTILSGALTCGSSEAYSSTGTISNASMADGNGIRPAMGGTLTGTNIHMLVVYHW